MSKWTSRMCGAIAASAVGCMPALAATIEHDKLRGDLERVLDDARADELVPVSIVMADQADRDHIAALTELAGGERRDAVVALLRDVADRTQIGVLGVLAEAEARGQAERIAPLWIVNAVSVRVTPAVAMTLAAREDVAFVNWDRPVGDEIFPVRPAAPDARPGEPMARGATPECGVSLIGADDVWNDLGVRGEGVVVCVIDTGLCVDHPDIVNRLWVNTGEIPGNGIDDDGNGQIDDIHGWNFRDDTASLADTGGHGSHVAGTVLGDGTQGRGTGVAPGASVMVAKFWNNLSGESVAWQCIQYAVANDADVVNGSFGWYHFFDPDRATWRQLCENSIAAGVTLVFAAGNGAGSPPSMVATPADVPGLIAVGAVDCDDTLAWFSSRGPTTWEDVDPYFDFPYPPGLAKPDVSAPGVDTMSIDFCSGYTTKSGTSMASPHVAGTAALVLSANPDLTPEQVKQVLMDTALDLGAPGMDSDYGAGRIDALAAVEAALDLIGCAVDWDGNGEVNAADVGAYLTDYFLDIQHGTVIADFDGNGVTNAADVGAFLSEYFLAIQNGGCA